MTRRRWIAEHWDEVTATIVGAQAEHMARVLRAQPGMDVDVVAGGHVFHAEVAAVTPAEVRFNLIAELQADPALPVTLVLSIYKFDRMEWALEKATELGVAAVAPVVARRSEKHLALARSGSAVAPFRHSADLRSSPPGRARACIFADFAYRAGRAGAHHHFEPRFE